MNKTKLLIGSLSNDLYRAACLIQRGSLKGAKIFLTEARRWVQELDKAKVKPYIGKIIADLEASPTKLDMNHAERYIMYSTLLQNYALHLK